MWTGDEKATTALATFFGVTKSINRSINHLFKSGKMAHTTYKIYTIHNIGLITT